MFDFSEALCPRYVRTAGRRSGPTMRVSQIIHLKFRLQSLTARDSIYCLIRLFTIIMFIYFSFYLLYLLFYLLTLFINHYYYYCFLLFEEIISPTPKWSCPLDSLGCGALALKQKK